MAALGAHPRLAAMMLAAETPGEAALAADLAALLEERDPLRGPDAPADIGLRLAAIADGDPTADRGALARIRRVAGAVSPAAAAARRRGGGRRSGPAARRRRSPTGSRSGAASRQLPAGRRRRRAAAARPIRWPTAPLLAVAALELKAAARIRMAAPLDPDGAAGAIARVTEQVETGFDPVVRRGAGAAAAAVRRAGAERPHRAGDPAEVAAALAGRSRRTGCARCPGPMPRASCRRGSR